MDEQELQVGARESWLQNSNFFRGKKQNRDMGW